MNFFKTLKILFISIFLFTSLFQNLYAKEAVEVNSKSHIMMDFTTGKILSENNKDLILPPASLTKIMTAYIAFDYIKKGKLNRKINVPVSSNAVRTARRTNSARSFFEERYKIDLDTALKGLIVHSGNDAAIAIAELIGGNELGFSNIMNEYAKKLKMENTHFNNASGLPTKNHYSTAMDLAILSKNLIKNFPELYAYYFAMKSFTFNDIYQPNRNKLLFREDDFDGIKTGWTNDAGYCFSTSIIRDGRRLIIVTLNADNPEQRFEDAKKLAEYGINNYTNMILTKSGKTIKGIEKLPLYFSDLPTAEVVTDRTNIVTLSKEEAKKIKAKVLVKKELEAPILSKTDVGDIVFYIDEEPIAESNIIVKNDYKIGNWKNYIADLLFR
tara:strand:- start:234 stop:1388 length:1155 start_codon:yes stop_codon:yes gene_type:complete